MSEEVGSKVTYLLLGLSVGWLVGILLAPKSGEGSRDYLLQKIKEGRKHARNKAREMRERAEDLVDHGKEMVNQKKEQIEAKLDETSKADLPEKSKAKGA